VPSPLDVLIKEDRIKMPLFKKVEWEIAGNIPLCFLREQAESREHCCQAIETMV
jgi:hypothetical protein